MNAKISIFIIAKMKKPEL